MNQQSENKYEEIIFSLVLTKGPVASKHVGEVGDDVEGGVDDVGHREVDDEVVCHRAHPGVGHHDPYDWGNDHNCNKYVDEKIFTDQ